MHPKIIFSFKVRLLMQISNTVTCVSYLLLLVLNPVTYGKTPFSLFTVPVRSRRFSLQELHSQHFPGQTFFIFILSKFWNIAAVQSMLYCLRCCLECAFPWLSTICLIHVGHIFFHPWFWVIISTVYYPHCCIRNYLIPRYKMDITCVKCNPLVPTCMSFFFC